MESLQTGRILSTRANAFSVESLIANGQNSDVVSKRCSTPGSNEGESHYNFVALIIAKNKLTRST